MPELPPWPLLALVASGGIAGSTMGVLADRLPRGETLRGRSRCRECGAVLGTKDLLPLAGWILRRGRCGTCKARIPIEWPLLETGAFGAALWLAIAWPMGPAQWTAAIAVWLALAMVVTDLRHRILPLSLNAGLLAAGGLSAHLGGMSLAESLTGGLACAGCVALSAGPQAMRVKRWPVGGGDLILAAAIGAWLGPQWGLGAVGAGAAAAWTGHAWRRWKGRTGPRERVPLGAWMAGAGTLLGLAP